MALADIEIVEIMGRRDLDRAGALLGVGILIGNDRDAAGRPAAASTILADQVLVALIVGMNGDAGIAQHRFGPRRGDDDVLVRALASDIGSATAALDLLLHHFEIGDGGQKLRVPIDQALVLVDQPFA